MALSMITSTFIRVTENGRISLFLVSEQYFIAYIERERKKKTVLYHSSVNGNLDGFHIMTVVNNTMNIGACISFELYLFLLIYIREV